MTWAQLAEVVGRPVAWTTSARLGQQPMTATQAKAAGSLLEPGEDVTQALQLKPTRGALESAVLADPTIYRFYDVLHRPDSATVGRTDSASARPDTNERTELTIAPHYWRYPGQRISIRRRNAPLFGRSGRPRVGRP